MAFGRFRFAVLPTAILCLALWSAAAPAQQKEPKRDEPNIAAPHAILIEAKSGSVLFERDADQLIYPASLAKLMTAEYVFHLLKIGKIHLTDEFLISEHAWRTGGAPSHTSTMFAAINSRVSVDDLLHGMIIDSANDACIALAEGIAGNEAQFADLLTRRAREIGLEKSTFVNSNGLPDPREQVTTRELALLARRIILDYPEFYPLFSQPDFTWNKIHQFNRNPLLSLSIGADGLKTGYTKEAGYGLVGSAVQDGMRLIAVINGEKTANDRARDGKRLLDWGFSNFKQRLLFSEGETIGSAEVYGGDRGYVPLQADGPVNVMVPKSGGDRLLARIVYTGPVPAPLQAGLRIGSLKIWRGDDLVLEVPLHATASVGKGSMTQRALDAVTESVIALLHRGQTAMMSTLNRQRH
jgi:serine-type D-Ala-D-Ala carboxypeptidase (penicillin-binding protein 5/6)